MKTEDIEQLLFDYFDRSVRQQPKLIQPRFGKLPAASREPVIFFGLKFAGALMFLVLFFSLPVDVMQRSSLGDKVGHLIKSKELTLEFNNLLQKADEYFSLDEVRKGGR
ncbi:MAG: hypothetical protein ACP5IA_04105 [Sediminispirochaetaceae bacterium]